MYHKLATALVALLAAAPAVAQDAPTLLHPLFQDHGVLQRERPIPVWGTARPGEQLRIVFNGATVHARADAQGNWRATLPAMPAGGPHVMTVTGANGTSQRVADLLVGDVWLCSGQSNMELGVDRALNAPAEIGSANDPQIRLMTIEHKTSIDPEPRFLGPVAWQPVTPQTVADFSAACYFMARDLRTTEKVPMGLIDSSWGGTAIDAWRGEKALLSDPTAKDALALFRIYRADQPRASRMFGERWMDWYRGAAKDAPGSEPWQAASSGWRTLPSFEMWETWGVPELSPWNGIVWYRTQVTLTAEQVAKAATLALGPADDLDVSFVNGVPVGTTFAWGEPRAYRLAPGTLKAGTNHIVVAVNDSWGFGGMTGTADQRAIRFGDGSSVALPEAAGWQFRIAPGGLDGAPHAPWEAIAGYSGIYNAMVAPLGSYGLRGVAWYQGESNAGAAKGYAAKLSSMMGGWRDQFGRPDLPFLVVQLAGWGPKPAKPVESGTAQIREEQRLAVADDANAALIVTHDIGDVRDIHPANKQDVGLRLAHAARALTYGGAKTIGAWPVEARREAGGIRVRFDRVADRLVTYSAAAPIGFELCGPTEGSCRFVAATAGAQDVLLDTAGGPADRVRFCWGDSPVCNLSDGSGLPVTSFELPVR